MIYTDNKMQNLFYILKNKFPDINTVYFIYNLNYGIKVITKDMNIINKIKQIPYFQFNDFRINEETFDFSPYLFYITYSMSFNKIEYLKNIYDDYLNILNKFNVNITMISEDGFMIENPELDDIDEIYNLLYKKYNYTTINNKHIFIIK